MNVLRPLACSSLLLAAVLATPAVAEPRSFTADYAVTLLGLPVARATFTSTFPGDGSVAVRGSVRSAGLARLFDSTRGNTSTAGRIGSDGVEPHRFEAEYVSGRRQQGVSVRFANGNVASTDYHRPQRPRQRDWVHVTDQHLRSVVDPLSATLIRASSAEEVCSRTVSVYDGWMRADLRLEPVSTGPVEGYGGTGAVCSGRFNPVAGYNSGSRDMRYMREQSNIRITFAPLGDTGLFAPVRASVGTRIGTIHVAATQIRTN
jgi:hypothetical protein